MIFGRRSFLQGLGGLFLPAPEPVAPVRTYFFAPPSGWKSAADFLSWMRIYDKAGRVLGEKMIGPSGLSVAGDEDFANKLMAGPTFNLLTEGVELVVDHTATIEEMRIERGAPRAAEPLIKVAADELNMNTRTVVTGCVVRVDRLEVSHALRQWRKRRGLANAVR